MELGTETSRMYSFETDGQLQIMGSKLYERELMRQHKENRTM
jgi:hypothetical protein